MPASFSFWFSRSAFRSFLPLWSAVLPAATPLPPLHCLPFLDSPADSFHLPALTFSVLLCLPTAEQTTVFVFYRSACCAPALLHTVLPAFCGSPACPSTFLFTCLVLLHLLDSGFLSTCHRTMPFLDGHGYAVAVLQT